MAKLDIPKIIEALENEGYKVTHIGGENNIKLEKSDEIIWLYIDNRGDKLQVGISGPNISRLDTIINKCNSHFTNLISKTKSSNFKEAVSKDLKASFSRLGVDFSNYSYGSISVEKYTVKANINMNMLFDNFEYSDKLTVEVMGSVKTYNIQIKDPEKLSIITSFIKKFEDEYLSQSL